MNRTNFENLVVYQFEVKHWLRRAYQRKLIKKDQIIELRKILDELSPKLSAYINSIGRKN